MSPTFVNPLTRLLGIQTPVVSAVMTGPSGGLLAAAVTKGGGFGFLSAGRAPSFDVVEKEIALARSHLSRPQGSTLPIGVGFFAYELDEKPQMVSILDNVLLQDVGAIWLSFGDMNRWIKHIRDSERARQAKRTAIFVQLPTVSDAVKAAADWDIDVVVLQGAEAGGHSFEEAPPIISLLPEVLRAIPNPPPILAAGGMATGTHLASMLALGASGIVVGTRFSAATESLLPQAKKEALIATQSLNRSATIRSPIFDELLGIRQHWPVGTTARGLRREDMLKEEADGKDLEERRKLYLAQSQSGGTHEIIWSGTSVGLISKQESAEDITRELHDEAVKAIRSTASIIAEA